MSTAHSTDRRIRRELRTVRVMIELYCSDNHGGGNEPCEECRTLWDYARQRVERCPFRADKPTCLNCEGHCFEPTMRDRVRMVMRYASPRMLWRHPVLALLHTLDGRRKRRARARS
jgi:hypothetical protein